MKNSKFYKKYIIIMIIFLFISIVIFTLFNIKEYKTYQTNYNKKISNIIGLLRKEYPKISEKEVIEILNNDSKEKYSYLLKYGINIENDSVISINTKNFKTYLFLEIIFLSFIFLILFIIFDIYNKNKEKKINEIIKYIEELNKRNYDLNIDSMSEDSLSILKNEIYKTTILLKETADNTIKDKINLKSSLEDISHQLKTPITSILIMLDNILEDKDMNQKTREEFTKNIKREVDKINFLVQSILKLSKFDSNTIKFIMNKVSIDKMLKEAIKNVSLISDLKNVEIITEGKNFNIVCDYKWQVEAITNILKNCLEYSKERQNIIIKYGTNNVYKFIEIKDSGDGINKKDIKHIFERFYKGENSKTDSIGIGLALAKTIIESNNGAINVESDENGTTFIIKYYNI